MHEKSNRAEPPWGTSKNTRHARGDAGCTITTLLFLPTPPQKKEYEICKKTGEVTKRGRDLIKTVASSKV